MEERLKTNRNPKHFFTYCATFLCFGLVTGSIGSQIYYYSEENQIPMSELSYLNTCKYVGLLIGGTFMIFFGKIMPIHRLLTTACVLCAIFMTSFTLSTNSFWMGTSLLLGASTCGMFIICTNVGIIVAHVRNDVPFWLLLGHSLIALGGLIAPILADLLKAHTLMAMSIVTALVSFNYFTLLTPESSQFSSKPLFVIEGENSAIAKYMQVNYQEKPKFIQYQVFGLILLYTGMETSFNKWIANYSAADGIMPSQTVNYSSVYLASIVLFRIVIAFIPGKVSTKIKNLIILSIFATIIASVLAVLEYHLLAADLMTVWLAFSLAGQFSLLLSIPFEYYMGGFDTQQSGNIVVACTLGQLLLCEVVGYEMRLNSNLLIFCELMLGIIMYVIFMKVEKDFQDEAARIKTNPHSKDFNSSDLKDKLIENQTEMKNMAEY